MSVRDGKICNINFQEWSKEKLLLFIAEQEVVIQLDSADEEAQKWWSQFRAYNQGERLYLVASTIAELVERGKTMQQFFDIYETVTFTRNISANLIFLDYIDCAGQDFLKLEKVVHNSYAIRRFAREILEHSELTSLTSSDEYTCMTDIQRKKALSSAICSAATSVFKSDIEWWIEVLQKAYTHNKSIV